MSKDTDTLAGAVQVFPATDPGSQHFICQAVFAENGRIDQHTIPVSAHMHEIRNSQRIFLREVKGLIVHLASVTLRKVWQAKVNAACLQNVE